MNNSTFINSTSSNSTSLPATHIYFENTVGRLLVHPAGHYTAIEYCAGPRQPKELHTFLIEAGNMLARWGWDKLLATNVMMPDFTPEETEGLRTYWRTNASQHPGRLYGALLLPHAVFSYLSWKATLTSAAV